MTLSPTMISIASLMLLGLSPIYAQEIEDQKYQGYVEGEYTWIGLPEAGQMTSISISRGDQVKIGDVLFTLDSAREVSQLNQAKATLKAAIASHQNLTKGLRPSEISELMARLEEQQALVVFYKVEFDREVKLLKTGASAQEKHDIAKAQLVAAQARLKASVAQLVTAKLGGRVDEVSAAKSNADHANSQVVEAEWRVGQRSAKSPVDALVFDTFYRKGEFVDKGKPVVSLLAPENIKVRFFVPETLVSTLIIGGEVALSCDNCPSNLKGNISYISPKAEFTPPVIYSEDVRSKLVFMIEVKISGDLTPFKPGLPIDVVLR